MSGEMDSGRLAEARQQNLGMLIEEYWPELLADRDHHFNRAEEAEGEAAQLLADLAEDRAKLKAAQRELAALRGELIR